MTVTSMVIGLLLTGCQARQASCSEHTLGQSELAEASPTIAIEELENERQAEVAALAKLDRRLSLNNATFTLDMVVHYVRDATHSNIAVNWEALKLVGIDENNSMPLSLEQVKASDVLRLALQHASADAFDDDKASYAVRNGIVQISTLRDLRSKTVLRLYNIDEFANARPTVNKRIYGRNNDARRMLGMTTLQNITVDPQTIKVEDLNPGFCANCDPKHDRLEVALTVMTYEEQVDQIIELINTTVGDTDEWLDEDSTLTEINGSMLIKTTPENHAQIRQLFESMRTERAQRFKRQALEMETFVLLEAAEAARLNQDYKEALKKINQALRVDPNSIEAQALKTIVTDTLSR